MEATLVDEKKLEELVDKAVQRHLKLTVQDMEEMRKSPAAAIIRIENRLDSLEGRINRDMVTRAELASFRNEIKEEFASTRKEVGSNRIEVANTRGDLKGDIANNRAEIATTRTEFKDEIAATRTEFKDEIAATRTEFKDELVKKHGELKDDIWKLRLLVIAWGIITILTNPKVVDLIGKLFNLFRP